MTKETLAQKIERLRELDKARTQGDWDYDGEETEASHDWDGYGYSLFPVDDEGQCRGFIADFDLNEEDAAFCKAAPEMMQVIERQATMLEVAREALIESKVSAKAVYKCIHHGHPCSSDEGSEESYMSVHCEIIEDKIEESLQKLEELEANSGQEMEE